MWPSLRRVGWSSPGSGPDHRAPGTTWESRLERLPAAGRRSAKRRPRQIADVERLHTQSARNSHTRKSFSTSRCQRSNLQLRLNTTSNNRTLVWAKVSGLGGTRQTSPPAGGLAPVRVNIALPRTTKKTCIQTLTTMRQVAGVGSTHRMRCNARNR